VRNPILLARAVMECTPHLLMVGSGAERFARRARVGLCRPAELVTERARERWRAAQADRAGAGQADALRASAPGFGTVGAAAVDSRGILAAATSTGGVSGKLPGRVGDSAILGAGVFADVPGAASATGQGEAIMKVALCREAINALSHGDPQDVARRAIADCAAQTGGKAGVIIVDKRGRLGFAHNAEAMDVATFDAKNGVIYRWVEPLRDGRQERSTRRS
jgi:L-asparaginase / beta-aspartyl-peptidase